MWDTMWGYNVGIQCGDTMWDLVGNVIDVDILAINYD